MNLITRGWISAGIALALLANCSTAFAVIVTHPWSVTVVGGPYNGTTGSGSFSYDDAFLDGFGDGTLGPLEGVSLSLTLFGQSFDETDDIDYNAYPQIGVSNFTPVDMDYIVSETDPDNPTPINQPGVITIDAVSSLFPVPGGGFTQDITLVLGIPEPASAMLAVLGAVSVMALRRRRD